MCMCTCVCACEHWGGCLHASGVYVHLCMYVCAVLRLNAIGHENSTVERKIKLEGRNTTLEMLVPQEVEERYSGPGKGLVAGPLPLKPLLEKSVKCLALSRGTK